MSARTHARLALGLWLLATTAQAQVQAQAPATRVREAISYREFQNRGGAPPLGRLLAAGEGPRGIDVDSDLRVAFDRARLVQALEPHTQTASPQLGPLRERIAKLTQLTIQARELPPANAALARALASRTDDATLAKLREERAGLYRATFDGLLEAIVQRRVDEGAREPDARSEARGLMSALLLKDGYDFVGLGRRFDAEVQALDQRVRALLDPGAARIGVEVRAHLLRQDGSQVALPLLEYNDEQEGPTTPYRRLQTELSPEQRALGTEYEALSEQLRKTRSASDTLQTLVQPLYAPQVAQVRQELDTFLTTLDTYRATFNPLVQELRPERLGPWLADSRHALPAELQAPFEALVREFQSVRDELGELESLRAEVQRLPGMTPLQAHDTLVRFHRSGEALLNPGRWTERAEVVRRFFTAVDKTKLSPALSQSGPLRAALDARSGLETLVRDAQALVERVRRFAGFLNYGGATLATSLPEPLNQRRRSGTTDLDTTVHLKTTRGGRDEGDVLTLTHRFYVDDRLVEQWEDRFVLNVYGLRAKALAGLAFWSRHENGRVGTWKPTPTLGWYVNVRGWPGDEDRGLRSPWTDLVGVGVSVLSVDFDATKDVELGVGGALTLFNNFAQVGYGLNLNAESQRGFFFFSIRPLELGELFSSKNGL